MYIHSKKTRTLSKTHSSNINKNIDKNCSTSVVMILVIPEIMTHSINRSNNGRRMMTYDMYTYIYIYICTCASTSNTIIPCTIPSDLPNMLNIRSSNGPGGMRVAFEYIYIYSLGLYAQRRVRSSVETNRSILINLTA